MEVLASLEGVRKRFGAVAALDGLDLEVRRGELLALLGPNGAGKTTVVSLMLGLQQPDPAYHLHQLGLAAIGVPSQSDPLVHVFILVAVTAVSSALAAWRFARVS